MPVLPDYPAPPGNKPMAIFTVTGPASYTVVTTGATPTGGQSLTASQIGMASLEFVFSGTSDDGQYLIDAIFPSNPDKAISSVILQWRTAATGAEVVGTTNLSGRTARLVAIGNY